MFVGAEIGMQRAVLRRLDIDAIRWQRASGCSGWHLDVDDLRTVVSKQLAAIACRDAPTDIEHFDTVERMCAFPTRFQHASTVRSYSLL